VQNIITHSPELTFNLETPHQKMDARFASTQKLNETKIVTPLKNIILSKNLGEMPYTPI
jgi:hypothetical protein